ncbi:MAG: extracellular solute-binding protein, partial [Desulfobacterales bacterium]|nr:extracellular solute-binding protein [Desulfobacterales bacterium]
KNMGQYIKSGSKPAKLTAAGEYAIGCSFAFVYSSLKKKGFPVGLVLPEEGAGYELEANALLKGAKHEAAAKKFLDWAISKEAMGQYARYKLGVTYPGISGPKDLPALSTIKLAPMDFPWQSENRTEILEVWQGHFLR